MLKQIFPLGLACAFAIATPPVLAQSQALTKAQRTNNPQTLYLLGQKELARFQFNNAIAIFKKALQISNNQGYTDLVKLSLFTTYKVAGVSKVDTFPHEAIPMLKAAIEMEPRDTFLYSRLGDAYCHKKIQKYTTCLHYYNEGIRVHPDKARGYFSRGVVQFKHLNDKPKAYQDFQRAINAALTTGDKASAQRYLEYARWMGMPVPKAFR